MKGTFYHNSDVLASEYASSDILILANMKIFADTKGQQIIKDSKKVVTESGRFAGIQITNPATTDTYLGCWIRDTYYAACCGYISPNELLNVYNLYKTKIYKDSLGIWRVPTVITTEGQTVSVTGVPAIDNNAFYAFIAVLYYELTRDSVWFENEVPYLYTLLTSASYDADGQIYNNADNNAATFGFYDSVKITGKLAFCNVLYWDALTRVQAVCNRLNIDYDFATKANIIKSLWLPTFWNGTYIKASTALCSGQFDVGAAAYAVSSGMITGTDAISITDAWYQYRDDLCDNETGMWKYVPTSYYHDSTHVWEAYNQPNWTFGTYQNGGYWTVMMPYILKAIKFIKGDSIARTYAEKLYNYQYANNNFYECNPGGTMYYCQSVAALRIIIDVISDRNLYSY